MPTPPLIQNFEENEPYIYASYAKEDAEKVFPIIAKLQSDGFRLWYDDNARTDKTMSKTAKEKLRHAMFFLAFLSPSYLQSAYCGKEFQKGQEKDFSKCILIHIENAEIDNAFAFLLARAQNVRWYMNADNEPLCYYVLYEIGKLEKCNIHGEVPSIPLSSVYGEDADMSEIPFGSSNTPQINTNRIKIMSFVIGAIGILIAAFLLLQP